MKVVFCVRWRPDTACVRLCEHSKATTIGKDRNPFVHLFGVRRLLELRFFGGQDEDEVAIGFQGCHADGVQTSVLGIS